MPLRLSAQAVREGTLSTLRPKTWVLTPTKRSCADSYDGIWLVQTGVQARGKKTRTTLQRVRNSDRRTFVPRWLSRVKSGAIWPTDRDIEFLLSEVWENYTKIEGSFAQYGQIERVNYERNLVHKNVPMTVGIAGDQVGGV